ncbi:MAG: Cdc6/Cdc18 family protein, partial [Candidatus Aminicenantales bacterium]
NPDILNEHYIPPNIPGREAQITELQECLSPALKRKKPIHSWLFGKPGTGKTLIATYILNKIKREANVLGVYINCWEYNSYYSVLDKIVRELRILGAEKLNSAFKMERLTKFIGSMPFVIVLDEIDQPNPKEREAILYNLSAVGSTGLVCICNSRYILMTMDERIKSRLSLKQIEFLPYSDQDLIFILEQRANFALHPDSWNRKILRKIAEIAEGDARIAIQTLKNSAYNADNDYSQKIKDKHIESGYNSAKVIKKTYLLNKLTTHHRILYDLVRENKEIESGKLWKIYLEKCKERNKQPIALRTFSEYMNKLIELDLVQWDRALKRGKVRVFKVSG